MVDSLLRIFQLQREPVTCCGSKVVWTQKRWTIPSFCFYSKNFTEPVRIKGSTVIHQTNNKTTCYIRLECNSFRWTFFYKLLEHAVQFDSGSAKRISSQSRNIFKNFVFSENPIWTNLKNEMNEMKNEPLLPEN